MNECFLLIVLAGFSQVAGTVSSAVTGAWGGWGEWTPCSVTCGYGSIKRSRNWVYADGEVSNFTYTYIAECWTKKPCPIHGGWGMWTAWSPCPVMCGGANNTRTRLCNTPEPANGGQKCQGKSRQTQACNVKECPALPLNFDLDLCNTSTFMCESKLQCVPGVNKCDFTLDCHDGSDERGCTAIYMEVYSNASLRVPNWTAVILLLTVMLSWSFWNNS